MPPWTIFPTTGAQCRDCGLWRSSRGAICLPGEGPEHPAIAFVGEAPGEEEEAQHRNFYGRAGQLLTKAIKAAGLSRFEVWIANAVRCRPPHPLTGKNRKPTAHEVDCCHGFLDRELKRLKPRVIVAMGDTAMASIFGERVGGVLDSRGKTIWSETYGAWVVCTFHPAYLLRRPSEEFFFIQDVLRAKTIAEQGHLPQPSPTDYRVIHTLDDAMILKDYLLGFDEVFYDWETNGVHLTKSEGFCCSFAVQPNEAFVVPRYGQERSALWSPADLRTLDHEFFAPIFMAPSLQKSGHHLAFDNCITKTTLDVWPQPLGFCTMTAHHALNNHLGQRAHGLKGMTDLYTDMGRYDDPLDQWLIEQGYVREGHADHGQIWRAPNALVWPYNAADSDAPCRMKPGLIAKMIERGIYDRFLSERMPLVEEHQQIDREGLRIDVPYLETLSADLASTLEQIRDAITLEVGHVVNPQSQPQVARLLFGEGKLPKSINFQFRELGLPILARTEGGYPSTKEEVLLQYREAHAVVDLILRYRAFAKIKGTYVDGTKEDGRKKAIRAVLDDDGRARMDTHISSLVTFRFATTKPFAIHTFPKNATGFPSVRALVIPNDGYKFISVDYVQQEFAIQAILAGQMDLVEAMLLRGEDIHEKVGADLFNFHKRDFMDATGEWLTEFAKNDYKAKRTKVKAGNFMIIYRGQAPKLARMLGCTHERGDLDCQHVAEAQAFIDDFYDKYTNIRWWQYDRIKEARSTGMVRGQFDFYRVLPMMDDPNKYAQMEGERMACNFPIQEGGAHVMIRSLLDIQTKWRGDLPLRAPFPGRVRFTVHDELNAEVRDDLIEEGTDQMVKIMTRPFAELNGWGLRVDPSVLDRWGG